MGLDPSGVGGVRDGGVPGPDAGLVRGGDLREVRAVEQDSRAVDAAAVATAQRSLWRQGGDRAGGPGSLRRRASGWERQAEQEARRLEKEKKLQKKLEAELERKRERGAERELDPFD